MGIAKVNAGCFDVYVIAVNNDGELYAAVQEYCIDGEGLHVLTCDGEQHFIPHWNIRKLEISEHDEGEQ